MKKTISILMAILTIMTSMTVFASASSDENTEFIYIVEDIEYTFEFSNSDISKEKQEFIAQTLLGLDDNTAQTYGLGCTLFGHDLKYTAASYITHKAYPYAPRCLKKNYEVEYCEDCDYINETFLASSYIHCCAED